MLRDLIEQLTCIAHHGPHRKNTGRHGEHGHCEKCGRDWREDDYATTKRATR